MGKAPKRRRPPESDRSERKQAKNLLLAQDALLRGEQYSRRHGTTLSRLVGDFLRALPLDTEASPSELTPAVARLRGVAVGGPDSARDAYREHLRKKYAGD
ncbi:MAG TPA: DUF6364 family protein [Gemmatimonadaceae bacterium]|nr:DUF6364 family protein [Gemmatimonadaceae bacterium]